MTQPDRDIQLLLDSLTQSQLSFALYRLPWADECQLVLQTTGKVQCLSDIDGLNGQRGFVLAPFRHSEQHPVVLVRPDVLASGWKEIGEKLRAASDKLQATNDEELTVTNQPTDSPLVARPSSLVARPSSLAPKQSYRQAFQRFITPLREGRFQKLVLSRTDMQPLPAGFSPVAAFVSACNSYPRMMIYLCHTPHTGTWMGSTPEILLSGRGRGWHTVALAGTMPMQADDVMPTGWSDKNREEQAFVAAYIRDIIGRIGTDVTEEGPYTTRAGQLVHLKTDFRFHLDDASVLGRLLQELHPTPAVCGLPKEDAIRYIQEQEGYDRRYYTGFIGWLDAQGQTDLYVNLRCMELTDKGATLYAGGGILPTSDAEAEWEETEEKMKTMKRIIGGNQ